MADIDKIGTEVVSEMTTLLANKEIIEQHRQSVQIKLRQVWDALEAGQTVNGATTKEGWAQFAGCTMRNLQYILRGGNKNRGEAKPVSRVITLKEDMTVSFPLYVGDDEENQHEMTFKIFSLPMGDAEFRRGRGEFKGKRFTQITLEVIEPEVKKPKVKQPKVTPGQKAVANQEKFRALKAADKKPVDPAKELMKRYRAAKRVAKFYCGMMTELMEGVDGKYDRFRALYPEGGDAFPWTPPRTDYGVPKSEKEFQAEYDAAIAEFDAVLEEGKAAGVLTTAP